MTQCIGHKGATALAGVHLGLAHPLAQLLLLDAEILRIVRDEF